jgi:hypothetical protein
VYLNNPYDFGKIYFRNTSPTYSYFKDNTYVDYNNKLYVYFAGSLIPPKLPAWWCVEEQLSAIFDANTQQDLAITGIVAEINEIVDALAITNLRLTQLQVYTLLDTMNGRVEIALSRFTFAQNLFLGVGTAALITAGVALAISTNINNNYLTCNLLNSVLNSNISYTDAERSNLSNIILVKQYSNCTNMVNNISNLNVYSGFINSNITTTQFIPSLNTNQISINNINVSNSIFINSNLNILNSNSLSNSIYTNSNASNFLLNSIITNSNTNNIYTSKRSSIIIPASNLWYDASNALYCYDLNIENYAPSINVGSGYLSRAFRISTLVPQADWLTKNNLLINNGYINYPEPLTFYMNNCSNYLGIKTPNNNYANGIILNKSANTNIGYWNLISSNLNSYNYIRYLSRAGLDMNVIIENLLS